MFDLQNYGSFIAAVVLFQLIPGAGSISILNAMARNGMGAGITLIGFGVRLAARN
jgi:leucine efflux protein